jgi:hypothetical protein
MEMIWLRLVGRLCDREIVWGRVLSLMVLTCWDDSPNVTLIFLFVRKFISQNDHNKLQKDRENLGKWAENWGMRFNATKCYIMSIKKKTHTFYQLGGHICLCDREIVWGRVLSLMVLTCWDDSPNVTLIFLFVRKFISHLCTGPLIPYWSNLCSSFLWGIVSKAFEKSNIEKNKVLTTLNHGFRSGYSCETQLLITINDLLKSYNKGKQIDMAILDLVVLLCLLNVGT